MLSSSFRFPCGMVVPNRIAKASMTERLAGPDCHANAPLARLYRTLAQGGAGLLLTGNVLVDSRYLEAPGNVVVENEDGLAGLEAWSAAGRSAGAAVVMQLNHAGRQTPRSTASESVAPSAVPLTMSKFFSVPRQISEREIAEVIERFAFAAAVAERAGFSGVEVHAAHGYLISQFLSPRVNRRTDRWGGSIENRARLLVRVVERIKEVTSGRFAVGVKLNVEDFVKGGLSLDDAVRAVQLLDPLRIDFLELTGGTHEYAVVFDREREQREPIFLEQALRMRDATSAPLILTGGMRTLAGMERALSSGACDMVGMARPFAAEPDLPRRLLSGQAIAARPIELDLPPPPRAALAELVWARAQLGRMARGRAPRPGMSPKWALLRMVLKDMGFARRRARHVRRARPTPFSALPAASAPAGDLWTRTGVSA